MTMPTFNAPSQVQQPAAPVSDQRDSAPHDRTFTQEDVDRIVGERLARDRAVRTPELPPPPNPPPTVQQQRPAPVPQTSDSDTPVFSDLISEAVRQAVQAAVAPLQQRFETDDRTKTQQAFTTVLGERAGMVLADPRDAALLDASTLVDSNGAPDPAKIDAALTQLVTDRPHLAKAPARPEFGAPSAQGAGFGTPGTSMTSQQAADDLRTRYGA